MALKDFNINSMSELENELSSLRTLSNDINDLLTKINATYANQSEGYASANSTRLAEAMQECSNKARKISDNVDTIERSVDKYRQHVKETDEA